MRKKVGPIKPNEVVKAKKCQIPDKVFDAFNKLIAKNWDGYSATVGQNEVIALIIGTGLEPEETARKRDEIFEHNWLDVEDMYRAAGWKVEYDKPGYNGNYEATFTFSKK